MADKIGFIGLGIMGEPMAKNLQKKGHSLLVYDLDQSAVQRLTEAGAQYATLAEIGMACSDIFLMLPNGAIVQQVLCAENGILSTLRSGSLVVDMSSITPIEAETCSEMLKAKGSSYIDSPVSGGEPGAIKAELAFMVGGEPEDFERAREYFNHMGKSAILIGPVGCGCVAKMTNQVIVNLTIAAVSEAFVLAFKSGVDMQKVYQAIRGGLAGSAVLDAKVPMMIAHDFNPGGKISINRKDIKNVMSTAYELDVPMPLTGQLMEIMKTLKNYGHLEDDHSGLVQYYELLAHVQINK